MQEAGVTLNSLHLFHMVQTDTDHSKLPHYCYQGIAALNSSQFSKEHPSHYNKEDMAT